MQIMVRGQETGGRVEGPLTYPISRGRRPRSVAPNPMRMMTAGAGSLNGPTEPYFRVPGF